MIVGFNHNISYKGVGFHVQTEDSGAKNPHLITLLYHGGTIIASQKTVYADILKVDNLDQVVEELAKEQHKGMLRRLTQGEFDAKIVSLGIAIEGADVAEQPQPAAPKLAAPMPTQEPASDVATTAEPVIEAELVAEPPMVPQPPPEAAAESVAIVEEPLVDKFRESKERVKREPTLDDLIYAYLTGADQC